MRTLLFLLAFASSQVLLAQGEVVAVHVSGKALYFAPGEKSSQNVFPGMRMDVAGSLRCQGGGSVKLLYNGRTLTINDGKLHVLKELEQLSSGPGLGFMGRFWSFLSSSMKQTKDEKTLEDNHRSYMEAAYAGVKGFATREYAIRISPMFQSKLSNAPVTFHWVIATGNEPTSFLLSRKSDGQEILTAVVQGLSYTADLSQLAIQQGDVCIWRVQSDADSASGAISAPAEFTYDPEGAAKALASLLPDPDYQHAFPVEQLLMQAFSLEQAGFYYDAGQKYAAAVAGHPRNALVRDTHAAFLARMDMLEEAKLVLKSQSQD